MSEKWWKSANPVAYAPADEGEWWRSANPATLEQALTPAYKEEARAGMADAYFPNLYPGAVRGGAAVVSPLLRSLGMGDEAARLQSRSTALEQLAEEHARSETDYPIVPRAVRGTIASYPAMKAGAMLGGPYGAIAAAGVSEADSSYHEARLKGKPVGESVKYAATQGVIEGAIAGVFQKLGLGGLESVLGGEGKSAVAGGVAAALKKAGKRTLEELSEEYITELGHAIESQVSGMDPDALTKDSLYQLAADTTAQTLLTMGVAQTVQAAERTAPRQAAPTAQPEVDQEAQAREAILAEDAQAREAIQSAPPAAPGEGFLRPQDVGPRLDRGRLAEVAEREAQAQAEAEAHPDLTPEGPPQQPQVPIGDTWQELPDDVNPALVPGAELYQSPLTGKRYLRLAGDGPPLQKALEARQAELQGMSVPQLNQEGSQYGLGKGLNKRKKIEQILAAEEQRALNPPQPKSVLRPAAPVLEQEQPVEPPVATKSVLRKKPPEVLPAQPPVSDDVLPPVPELAEPPVVTPKSVAKKRKPIKRADVVRTFPGARVEDKPNGWTVHVGKSYIDVELADEIPVNLPQMEKQLGRKLSPAEQKTIRAAGVFTIKTPDGKVHDGLGLIRLAHGDANDATLRHEALHLAKRSGLLSEAEWQALVDQYGDSSKSEAENEEAVARSRESWEGAKTTWDKIKSWLNRLLASIGITKRKAQDIMHLLDESGFWQREGTIAKETEVGRLLQARGEAAFQPVGRPDLANPGETQAVRNLVDETDQERNDAGQPEVRPDAEVQAEARQRLAADYEGEKAKLLEMASRGGQLLDTETVIAKTIVNREGVAALVSGDTKARVAAMKLIDAYRRTGTQQARGFRQRRDPIETPAERMRRHVAEAVLTPPANIRKQITAAQGNQAEIDRLNAEWAKKIDEIKAKLKALGVDLDKLNEWGYSPIREAEVMGVIDQHKATVADAFHEYWRNAILSSPRTHVANTIGNFVHGAWHFAAERLVEAGINKIARRPEGAQLEELPYIIGGILPGISRGARNALMTWRTELPWFDKEMGLDGSEKYDIPHVAIPGWVGKNIVRVPQRALLAADQFARAMFSEMEVGAAAYEIAKGEGHKGDDLRTRIAELTADIDSKAWADAYEHSLELTFQQSGGKVASGAKRAALALRGSIPVARYVMPFVTFPVNMLETAVKKSPLGSIDLSAKMYANYKAGRPVMQGLTAQAAQQFIASVVLLALLGNDEDEPWITGAAGQANRDTRELANRIGRPSLSIKLGDKWYSYARLEPFATILGTMVDTANAIKSGNAVRAVTDPLKSLIGQFSDKTFLSGLSDFYEAVQTGENWEERVGRYASNFAVSWVPNLYRTGGRAADTALQQRGVWGKGSDWWSMLAQRTLQKAEAPGVESEPQFDLWGRPIPTSTSFVPRTDWLYRMTVPSDNRKEDIFVGDQLLLNWNLQNPGEEKYPAPPQRYYRRGGKTHYFTDEQFATYSRIAGQVTQKLVQSERWAVETPTAEDVDKLTGIIQDARETARDALIAEWNGGPKVDDSERGIAILAAKPMLQTLSTPRPVAVPKTEREKGTKPKEYFDRFNSQVSRAKDYLKEAGISRQEAVAELKKLTASLEPENRRRRLAVLASRLPPQ